jgi:hypothetical membrane protein
LTSAPETSAVRSATTTTTTTASTIAAAAGIVGPACFVGGWLAAAALRPGYSSVHQAISQLARLGAPHRALMSGAFASFGLAMPVFAPRLARALGGGKPLRVAVTTAGLATLAIAGVPLSLAGGGTRDLVHGSLATVGYIGMVASATLGTLALRGQKRRAAAAASGAVAIVAVFALSATTFGEYVGFWQRLGLTVIDVWFAVLAASILVAERRDAGC